MQLSENNKQKLCLHFEMPSDTVQNYTMKRMSTPEGPVAWPQTRQLLMVDFISSSPTEHKWLDES